MESAVCFYIFIITTPYNIIYFSLISLSGFIDSNDLNIYAVYPRGEVGGDKSQL